MQRRRNGVKEQRRKDKVERVVELANRLKEVHGNFTSFAGTVCGFRLKKLDPMIALDERSPKSAE